MNVKEKLCQRDFCSVVILGSDGPWQQFEEVVY